jgi:hypothetical protein
MTLEENLRHTIPGRGIARELWRRRHAPPKRGGLIAAWLAHVYELILGREPRNG